jgi:RimJ/RimL family protein N-acetyltransferase
MIIFDTARLHLRPYQPVDMPHIFRLQSDEETMRYIRPPVVEEAEIVQRTELWLQYSAQNPGYGVWILETIADGAFVGYAVLRHVDFKPGAPIEIGYTLDKTSWGKGYATEATEALMEYATKQLGITALVAYTDETNLASNRVLEKCGFYRAGMEHIYGGDCLRWEWKA